MQESRKYISLSAETILQRAEWDDFATVGLILLLSICYSLRGIVWAKEDPYHHLWFEKPQSSAEYSKSVTTRDISLKLEQDNKSVVIFWGSQSGTAEGFANRLAFDCKCRFGLDAIAVDLAEYDPASIGHIPQSKIAIFIISTYGEGDPSDNASDFLSWLERNKTARFSNLRYAAFGLGNKKYKFYNRAIDIVCEALGRLEAKPLLAAGKADDSMGTTEEDFMEWKETLFSVFRDDLGCDERPKQYEPKMRVVQDNSLDVIDLHIGQPLPPKNAKKTAMMSSSIQALTVKITKRLLSTADRNYIHLELDTSEYPELKYKTGDHLAIWPSNPISEVDRLIKVLGLENQRQIPLLISSLDPSIQTKVPSPTTIEALFGYYLEICAPVRREVVLSLAQYAPTIAAKMRLIQLGEDKDIYSAFCSSTNITFGRLLESVTQPGNSWANLPLSFVLESLCCLSPRYYSISSSSVVHPKQIAITVATSTFNTSKQPILGLTTSYLSDVEQSRNSSGSQTPSAFILDGSNNVLEHGKVFAHIRKSKFRLPVLAKNPIIMVASGSGIAPFRGFLQERARLASIGRDVGPSILFFGCRRADEDYLYYKELQQLNESLGERMEVNTAFSRQDVNKRGGKMYVQDRIEEHYRMLLRLLMDDNAYFYICGSAGMALEVGKRVGEAVMRSLGWGEGELREWLEQMKKTHRWQEDVWG